MKPGSEDRDLSALKETVEEPLRVVMPSLPGPTLRLLYSGEAGVGDWQPHPLRAAVTPIGRMAAEEGICLQHDERVSRLHATVQFRGDGLRAVDAGSKNGVFVNGQRVSEGPLRDGDILRLGNSLLLLRHEPAQDQDVPVHGLLGRAPSIRALRTAIHLLGPSQATVLLTGESGTGKEVVARALHQLSGRGGAFVAVNCSAIAESLAESQLFGHVAGAFTGAHAQPGWFRAAHGGTLLLDEIGELSTPLQPKLLRALEERSVIPVGAVSPVSCDVRLVAATNRDLLDSIEAGRFRGDLYARLAEITLHLPPLRDRREDVLLLLQKALGPAPPRLSPDLAAALVLHRWPYNVRELLKVATELRIRGAGARVLDLDLVAERLQGSHPKETGPMASMAPPADLPIPCKDELLRLLREHKGIISDIARAAGRSRTQVYRWLRHHDLDAGAFRTKSAN